MDMLHILSAITTYAFSAQHLCNQDILTNTCTEIGVFKETYQIGLCSLLKNCHCTALLWNLRSSLEILSNFSHKSLERKLPDQKLSTLLVLPDLSQSHGSWL
ncbi:hypothetical protein Q3G72_028377 [Acer saccharum]|nr:hypothetical protein Q3G72_028377 [Acer saccharum]